MTEQNPQHLFHSQPGKLVLEALVGVRLTQFGGSERPAKRAKQQEDDGAAPELARQQSALAHKYPKDIVRNAQQELIQVLAGGPLAQDDVIQRCGESIDRGLVESLLPLLTQKRA